MTQAEDRAFWAELRAAQDRVGRGPIKNMAWVLEFARQTLDQLSQSQLLQFQYDVLAFAFYGLSGFDHSTDKSHLPLRAGYRFPQTPKDLPTVAQLRVLHHETTEALRCVVKKEEVFMDIPACRLYLAPSFRKGGQTEWSLVTTAEQSGIEFAFEFTAMRLLWRFASQIRRCEQFKHSRCRRKLFVARRSDQVFCSSTCQVRASARKRRHASPKRQGKRGRPRKAKRHLTVRTTKRGPHGR